MFFTSNATQLARRGVVQMKLGVPEILNFEEDSCFCTRVEAQPVQLVHDQREFVITRFSPLGGTCVGSDVVRILSVGEDGALVEIWRGTTFEADGSQSRIATIEFTDQDEDGDLEIVRRGKLIDCGDDCLCREGPVLETFVTIHVWDAENRLFVPIR